MFVLHSNMLIPTSLILLAFLAIPTEQSTPQLNNYGGNFCLNNTGNYTQGSAFQRNLNTLLLDLESSSSSSHETTAGEPGSPDHVFGRYYCRHDIPRETCGTCVKTATKRIVNDCPTAKEAVVYFEHCTLLYLNSSARLDDHDVMGLSVMLVISKVMDLDKFYPVLVATMDRLVNESAYGTPSEGFATAEANVSQFETLYSLTQCSSDMSRVLCERCLRNALYRIDLCCKDDADMSFFFPSCQLRYSVVAPFYSIRNSPPQTAISPSPPASAQATTSSSHQHPPVNGADPLGGSSVLWFGVMINVITTLVLSN